MKQIFLSIVLLVISFFAGAQDLNVDSLVQLLKGPLEDTTRIKIEGELLNEYYQTSPDSAIKTAEDLFHRSVNANYTRGISVSLIHRGRSYKQKGDYLRALDFLLMSLNYTGYYDSTRIIGATYYEISKVYAELHNILHTETVIKNSILYAKKAMAMLDKQLLETKGDIPLLKGGIHLELGRAYVRLNSIYRDSASYHFRKAFKVFDQLNEQIFKATILQDFSMLYLADQQYDSSLYYARKGGVELQSGHLLDWLSASDNLIARIYGKMKKYDSAHWYIDKSIKTQLASGNYQFLDNSYEIKAEVYLQEKKYNQAIKFYQLKLELSKRQNNSLSQEVAYNGLVSSYKQLPDYRSAFYYLETVTNFHDSIELKQDLAKMENLQSLFNSAQKQKQIELLEQQQGMNELLLKRNRLIAVVIGVSLVIAVIAIVLIVRQNQVIRKSKQEQARLFAEVDRMKSKFFANISHEFRTPLTLMLTPLDKRVEQASSQADRDEWIMMQRNGQRLLSLVNQLLDLSKIEAGRMTLQLERINISEWSKPMAGQFASIAESRNISFRTNVQTDITWPVDRDKMEQVILNLLSNAFKFTQDGGAIELSLNQIESHLHIVIRDSGIGIPSDQLHRIFDRFYQVDDSHAREYEGTGIGLALAKELVELHGGTITVNSEYGKGSSFKIMLPDHPEVKQVVQVKPGMIRQTMEMDHVDLPDFVEIDSDPRPSVLVVEDNIDLRNYVANELSKEYRVLIGSNGREGIEQAQQIPDLIISDLMMPKVDGLELCRQIKSGVKTSHIPVILLTAKADQQMKTEGLQTGADDYIPKPFHLTELLARVQNLIETRKRLRKLYSAQITLKPSDIQGQSLDDRFIKRVLEAIEFNLANPLFGVEPLADAVAMSSIQVYRKLKAITGKTPNEIIREVRLERAASLLMQHMGTVAEVAYQVGFNNLSYFSKCFREKFGATPSEFSKRGEN